MIPVKPLPESLHPPFPEIVNGSYLRWLILGMEMSSLKTGDPVPGAKTQDVQPRMPPQDVPPNGPLVTPKTVERRRPSFL